MKSTDKKILIILSSLAMLFSCIAIVVAVVVLGGNDKKGNKKNSQEITKNTEKITSSEKETKDDVVVEADKDDMTIMVYMLGSNLERDYGYITSDITKFMEADMNDNINIVVQAGGSSYWNNEIFEAGSTHRFSVGDGVLNDHVNMGTVNMASEDTLADFIKNTYNNYPAEKYTLILWNHGGQIPLQYGVDDMFPGEEITCSELNEALSSAGVHFETVIFDACLMATLETAYAIKDYADYMVAAESIIWGGLPYETLLADFKNNPDGDIEDYFKEFMQGYMKGLESTGELGSISMVDLDKVDEVYEEYIEYAKEVETYIRQKGYEEYLLLRNSCGYYSETDTVDIVKLASTYYINASNDLINAVHDAVIYTESDYEFSYGLATYSPHRNVELYSEGRQVLVELGYDDIILDYLDVYSSISLKYLGDTAVKSFAGDWYDVAAVENQVGVGVSIEPQEYQVATIQKDGYEAVTFAEGFHNKVKMSYIYLYLQAKDGRFVMLGTEAYNQYDSDGDLVVGLPKGWTKINGNLVCTILVDKYSNSETGAWYEMSGVLATCNGNNIIIITYYGNDCPNGKILGYKYYEPNGSNNDSNIYRFNANDVIRLIHPVIDANENVEYTDILKTDILASQLTLSYEQIDLTNNIVLSHIEVEDIYGNTYGTEGKLYN